jgi:hypothetical protein
MRWKYLAIQHYVASAAVFGPVRRKIRPASEYNQHSGPVASIAHKYSIFMSNILKNDKYLHNESRP